MRLDDMGANDRSFKYSVGEWGRKARKYLNNLRRLRVKEDTDGQLYEQTFSDIAEVCEKQVVDSNRDVEYDLLKREISRLKQEVRELKRDLKNSKQETKKWQDKWWDECFKYGR